MRLRIHLISSFDSTLLYPVALEKHYQLIERVVVMERRTFLWLWDGLDALEEPKARGMQRESASVSLAKIAGTTPHILH